MGRCQHCDTELTDEVRFTCNFCDADLCSEHRLPEKHNCLALRSSSAAASAGTGQIIGTPEPEDDDSGTVEKTPCEECGRPSPADEDYCSPCKKDLINRKQTASQSEIREHRRKHSSESADGPSRRQRMFGRLPHPGRRSFLALLGITVAGAGYRYRSEITSQLNSRTREYQLGQVGLESVRWDVGTLILEFDPEFQEYDGWIIHHEYEDPSENQLFMGKYPRFGGPIELPFSSQASNTNYPTRTFSITAYTGQFSSWDAGFNFEILGERGPSADFEAPKSAVPDQILRG